VPSAAFADRANKTKSKVFKIFMTNIFGCLYYSFYVRFQWVGLQAAPSGIFLSSYFVIRWLRLQN
uniref:hypothetical protein n=1 Tax=Prevotella sp. TaxID=59823 RepID=UPI00402982E5